MSTDAESALSVTFEPAALGDFAAIHRLLTNNHLPVTDLAEHLEAFTLAKRQSGIVGTVGLEGYGGLALLRSLCVAEAQRGRGIGAALLSAATRQALARGVERLYLLTTGAAPYFAALGFVPVHRADVPPSIRATAQFSSLCPASAVCMTKTIDGRGDGLS
jgi:amino-acid N-acetyltransferase